MSRSEKRCCPVQTTMDVIGGKWKIPILWVLRDEIKRFGQIKKEMTGITQKMLTAQLRELETDGVISRKVYAQVPPRVEYALTPIGKRLLPVFEALCDWGTQYNSMGNKET